MLYGLLTTSQHSSIEMHIGLCGTILLKNKTITSSHIYILYHICIIVLYTYVIENIRFEIYGLATPQQVRGSPHQTTTHATYNYKNVKLHHLKSPSRKPVA